MTPDARRTINQAILFGTPQALDVADKILKAACFDLRNVSPLIEQVYGEMFPNQAPISENRDHGGFMVMPSDHCWLEHQNFSALLYPIKTGELYR
jgi:hypothetical protein